MIDKRPININPLSIRLPVAALVSISHRISGVIVFLLIPILLYILEQSLQSAETYAQISDIFSAQWLKFSLWVLLAGIIFHLLAGIRHLIMDMHIGDSLRGGRIGAILVFAISAMLIVAAATWVWG